MTNRALIKLLLEQDLDAEVFFEMNFDDEEDPEWIDIEDVIQIDAPEGEEELPPVLLLVQSVVHPNPELN